MTTPRTTKKSRTSTRPGAVRHSNSKFKNMENYKRATAADTRHVSAAQIGARLVAAEKQVLRATNNAIKIARSSMREAVAAANVVRSSMKDAVAAVRRATKRVARRVSAASHVIKPTARTTKRPAGGSSRRPSA